MSKKRSLRGEVVQRLMAAADEVFALIEQAFAEHEEEVRLKCAKNPELQHKEAGVPIPLLPPESALENTEAEQTLCKSLNNEIPFTALKSDNKINKQALLPQDPSAQTGEQPGTSAQSGTSALPPPGRSEIPPSCSDTDDSDDWETSAGKRTQNDAEESDTAGNSDGQADSSSRKRRKRRKTQHEANQGGVVIKREREDETDTCMQIGAITDAASLEACVQTSANTSSASWMNLLTQHMKSTDPLVLMHEMLAKQDVLLQQQEQIFSLLSTSQLQIPECSLNYKDLPLRDQPALTETETRLPDQDYRTKLSTSILSESAEEPSISQESNQSPIFEMPEIKQEVEPLSVDSHLIPLSEMHISIQEGNNLPEVERCTRCCNQYHCPFCRFEYFFPTRLTKVKIHLKTHFNRAIRHGEFTIHRCGDYCLESFHYHCVYCKKAIKRKDSFIHHLQEHCRINATLDSINT